MSRRSLLPLASVAAAIGCHRAPPPPVVGPPPALPQQFSTTVVTEQLSPGTTYQLLTRNTPEEHVQVETYGRDVDVRDILTFLGQRAGLRFVFAPEINRKIRVSMNDVPVSLAIQTVLSLANLTLEGSTPGQRPLATSVVFYELPVNVDSLSADAIMKRFGVGRTVAEMLVEARARRP